MSNRIYEKQFDEWTDGYDYCQPLAYCSLSPTEQLQRQQQPSFHGCNVSLPRTAMSPYLSEKALRKSSSNRNNGEKGLVKTSQEDLCLICGDRATGYHYNALSCEGCKGFFRRSVTRGATYNCKYFGHCEMDMWMRRRCQACRMRRCIEVGMRAECLLSDEQCRARDARRKARQDLAAKDAATSEPGSVKSDDTTVDLQSIPEPQRDLIETVVSMQDYYELPSEDQINKISQKKHCGNDCAGESSDTVYQQMTEITVLVTQLIVEFAKQLPGFKSISREDQIQLLKASAGEVMLLRASRRYDAETDSLVFANGMPYQRDHMRAAWPDVFVTDMFNFCRNMAKSGVDNAEYALLISLCIFSADRPQLQQPQAVEQVQEPYIKALTAYQEARVIRCPGRLAKLLLKLTDLRSLSAEHEEVLLSLRVQRGSLPPLLAEYFDIKE